MKSVSEAFPAATECFICSSEENTHFNVIYMIQIPSALYSELLSALQCLQCQIKAEYNMVYIITHRCCCTCFVSCRSQGKGFCLPNYTLRLKNMNLLKGRLTPSLSVIDLMSGFSLK